jgi:acyl-coenzyme A thioesterase PaaI-like protein
MSSGRGAFCVPQYTCARVATSSSPIFLKLIRRVNLYPPYLGMGISVSAVSPDFTRFEVQLKARWYNRNLFGTHFGGSLYSMADPFYVFIVMMNFGSGYVVWDKAAGIDFLRPAKGTIVGVFEIGRQRLEEMRAEVDRDGRSVFRFETDLKDEAGQAVARVRKDVHVRAKDRAKPRSSGTGSA